MRASCVSGVGQGEGDGREKAGWLIDAWTGICNGGKGRATKPVSQNVGAQTPFEPEFMETPRARTYSMHVSAAFHTVHALNGDGHASTLAGSWIWGDGIGIPTAPPMMRLGAVGPLACQDSGCGWDASAAPLPRRLPSSHLQPSSIQHLQILGAMCMISGVKAQLAHVQSGSIQHDERFCWRSCTMRFVDLFCVRSTPGIVAFKLART